MKKIFLLSAVVFTVFTSRAQFTSATLTASGLTCAMCTKAIYNALGKIPSVGGVDADIKNSSFAIHFKEGATIDPDILKAAVEQAGFSISKLRLSGHFNNIAVNNNAHVNIGGKTFQFLQVNGRTSLNGTETLTMVDKKFLSAKEFRKYAAGGGHECLQSGKAEECCPKTMVAANSRIYHVIL